VKSTVLSISLNRETKFDQLQALSLSEKKRRAILRNAARKSRDLSVKRVARGRNTDGNPWETPKKKRIFKKINQKKRTYIKTSGSVGEIHYKNSGRGYSGAIAKAHARELETKFSTEKMREALKKKPKPNYKEPATKQQAKRLIALGYKVWDKDSKKFVKVTTQKYIINNITFGKAGFLINLLKAEAKQSGNKEWTVKRPKRELLGNEQKGQKLVRKQIRLDVLKKS